MSFSCAWVLRFSNNWKVQWLKQARTGVETDFSFPTAFSTLYNAQLTHTHSSAGGDACFKSISKSGGVIRNTAGTNFYVMGIGK